MRRWVNSFISKWFPLEMHFYKSLSKSYLWQQHKGPMSKIHISPCIFEQKYRLVWFFSSQFFLLSISSSDMQFPFQKVWIISAWIQFSHKETFDLRAVKYVLQCLIITAGLLNMITTKVSNWTSQPISNLAYANSAHNKFGQNIQYGSLL